MKKLSLLMCGALLAIGVAASAGPVVAANAEGEVASALQTLVNKYIGSEGKYTKKTTIGLNSAARTDHKDYFHCELNESKRTTYYNGNRLLLAAENGEVRVNDGSYYYADSKIARQHATEAMTEAIDWTKLSEDDFVQRTDASGLEDEYPSLKTFAVNDYFSAWGYDAEAKVYYYDLVASDLTPLVDNKRPCKMWNDFLAFCAPMFYPNTGEYLTPRSLTIEEKNNGKDFLVLSMYLNSTDAGKLDETYFAQARIYPGNEIFDETYLNKDLHHIGQEIQLDLSSYFSSRGSLAYSSNIGAIDSNGVFTFTPTCGGYFDVVITASTGTEESKLAFTLTVAGTITEQTSKKATISTEPQTIAGIEALAGEAAIVNKSGIVETILNVPASNETQVLSFAYTANAGAKIVIEVRDTSNVFKYCLFNGDNTASGVTGQGGLGNTKDGAYAVTPGQIITLELNPYFTLTEDTQLKFVFKNAGSTGATMGVSSITVGPQSNFNKYQTTEYGDWYSINENADNTVSVAGNTVRVDVKGVGSPSSDSVIALYQTYLIPSDSTLKNNGIKLWIEGNADYRILMIDSLTANAVKEGNQTDKPDRVTQSAPYLNPNKTAITDPDLLGWNTATTDGVLNWYGGSSSIAGHQIVVIVMVKASTANTYIEFCDGALHA